ncbi:CheR family methyltransferase [Caballeronia zhejiangensis]|nr:CheR family methyltransferase [Caballeronia zhejiangensis]
MLCDPPFSRVDLVSCRNLLIYMDRRAQKQVFEMNSAPSPLSPSASK